MITAGRVLLRPPFFAAVFAVIGAVVLSACGGQQAPPQMPPMEVGTLEVHPSALSLSLEYAAQLRGAREVEVRSRVSGILLKRMYQEGSAVKEGALLFRIDPAPFRAEAARAQAEVGVQQANLQQSQRERDRILPLYEQKLVSLRDRDNAVAAYESAKAGVEAAKASLNRAQLDLSYTDVRAPISGLTSREARSEGSLVTAGDDSSLLTHIVQGDRLYVQFSVSDSEAESLRAALAAGPINVRVVDTQGKTLGENAPIEFIAPSVGNGTGTVDVRAVLDNAKGTLLPGQVTRARIEGISVAGSMVIPKRAMMHGIQGPFVWLVGPENKVDMRPVKVGIASGNNVAVTEGLQPGDKVVVDGVLKVGPGAVVKAVPIESAKEQPATTREANVDGSANSSSGAKAGS